MYMDEIKTKRRYTPGIVSINIICQANKMDDDLLALKTMKIQQFIELKKNPEVVKKDWLLQPETDNHNYLD